MFAVVFKLGQTMTKSQFIQSTWQTGSSFATGVGEDTWEKGKCCFPEQTHSGAGVHHRVEYTLQGGSYNSLILWHLSDYCKVHFTLDYQVQIFPA